MCLARGMARSLALVGLVVLSRALSPPRATVASLRADVVAADAAPAVAALASDGVVRVEGVLAPRAAAALLAHVNERLETALREAEDEMARGGLDGLDPSELVRRAGDALARSFGDAICPGHRRDLKLSLDPPVRRALAEVLDALQPTLAACLGARAELYELAALVSDPGARAQPVHPDTPFYEGEGAAVMTAFVALQPVDASMGPTLFLPGTHSRAAHDALLEGDRAATRVLSGAAAFEAVMGAGDCTLYDSRLLHRGGANTSARRRVLFYCSFRARGARMPARGSQGTMLEDLRDKHELASRDRWLAESPG